MILKEKRTASVRAVDYCEIFVLTEQTFNQLKLDYPEMREVMKKMSSEKSDKISRLVMDGIVL